MYRGKRGMIVELCVVRCLLAASRDALSNKAAQRGARTHDPEIKSLMLYRLS